jgi:hypothetical protein
MNYEVQIANLEMEKTNIEKEMYEKYEENSLRK